MIIGYLISCSITDKTNHIVIGAGSHKSGGQRRRVWHKRLWITAPGLHSFLRPFRARGQNVKISIWLLVRLVNECLLRICGQCHSVCFPTWTYLDYAQISSLFGSGVCIGIPYLTEVKLWESHVISPCQWDILGYFMFCFKCQSLRLYYVLLPRPQDTVIDSTP